MKLLEIAMAVETEKVPHYLRWKSKIELILVDQESSPDVRASSEKRLQPVVMLRWLSW